MSDDQSDEQAVDKPPTRRVRVRVADRSPYGGTRYRFMDLPVDVAGQWDDGVWSSRPPGV